MAKTVLQLVQTACYEGGLTSVPSALSSATDFTSLQLLNLLYSTGRELLQEGAWSQLKRSFTVYLEPRKRRYHLPQDFYTFLPFTQWDDGNGWGIGPPYPDDLWNTRLFGAVTVENRKAFRLFGPSNPNDNQGQFVVDPVPGDSDAGQRITFDYISRNWIIPPLWTASETVAQNAYRFSCGNIYKKTDAGSEVGSTIPPSVAYGEAPERDSSAQWKVITVAAWIAATSYDAGAYVTNGGNLYRCVTSGVSAGSGGPSGTSADITDNTAVWDYVSAATPAFSAFADYSFNDVVYQSGVYYRCTVAGQAGQYGPNWTATTVADGNITWTFQAGAYDTIQSDSDLCLFDDEAMIAGIIFKFRVSKGTLEGAKVFEDIWKAQKMKAKARWNVGKKMSLAGGPNYIINIPDGNFSL